MEIPDWKTKLLRLVAICVPVVALDQITKILVVRSLELGRQIVLIPGFFAISHVHNTGGVFGMGAGEASAGRVLFFLAICAAAGILVLWFYAKTPPTHPWFASGLCLVFGGAIGNALDRARLGEVVDFLDFQIRGHHWPSFNVADAAITVGVVILVLHFLLKKEPF